ncbi:Histidine biosynthesis bifunctional protein hisB [Hanseniaspora vineae]
MSNKVYVIDVGSGNLRSLINAIKYLDYEVELITKPEQIPSGADLDPETTKLIFPGVGNFGHFVDSIYAQNFDKAIKEYIANNGKIMGICVGLQTFFAGSEESPNSKGLNFFQGLTLSKFDDSDKPVPEIGWNSVFGDELFYGLDPYKRYYFVHSYAAILPKELVNKNEINGWKIAKCTYGNQTFISAVQKGNIFATQFHPEKSGMAGIHVIDCFLKGDSKPFDTSSYTEEDKLKLKNDYSNYGLTRRIIACLDVRSNDNGDLVVTKGDQYDVREKSDNKDVRNLGKPVALASKYYEQGADEVTFLNITSFRNCPVKDAPMLEVLEKAAETIFVPLTVGGGIKDVVDVDGTRYRADDVASLYFRSGADKVSIGSDAVYAAEKFIANGYKGDGTSPIETISKKFGAQAVVISVDPKRVYVDSPQDTKNKTFKPLKRGPNGEEYCWYQCTIMGGRESRDLGVYELITACEKLGAGEILLNCIDKDGSNSGYDLELIELAKQSVKIPVIASSGAGVPQHFKEAFLETNCDACLGAGMFHREEYTVNQVKEYLLDEGLKVRMD